MREKLDALNLEFNPYGIDLVIRSDRAQDLDDQLTELQQMAISGFMIALLVLFLFLRKIRAVAVVATAVPVSLLIRRCLLYLAGYSLNMFTLLGRRHTG